MSLIRELATIFPPERLKTRPIDLHAWSVDAGFYTLVPKAVVFPMDIEEIRELFRLARVFGTSVTFRTGGTSLSGQSISDGILADLSRHWKRAVVERDGLLVRFEPGLTGQAVNRMLASYRRKIGPDPASIAAAMMGGILSNNSSGMCCGVKNNSYHTVSSLRFVLPDGCMYDTADVSHYALFESASAVLAAGIRELRSRVLGNSALVAEIRRKYRMKNTVGYSLNAFLDFEHPLDILAHLLIGAEGTLAFIASAVLETIPDKPFKRTGLLFFSSPRAACDAIPMLTESGAEALEFMDRAALRSIEDLPGAPAYLKGLAAEVSCLLCEYQADDVPALERLYEAAASRIAGLALVHATEFTSDPAVQAVYWKLRKGMYPSVAAVRAKGTSVMLEDVAVPVERLGEAIVSLQELFARHGYDDALVFGHAREGNLHFLVSQSIATAMDIELFRAFNDDLAELIIRQYKGSLKAEHGTGRQIAPYVRDEWGDEAYEIMCALKALVDPDGLLNPGVILNPDAECHLKHLKSLPVVEGEVDKCVECGYCEHRCPSREYTLTPRQRIVLRRSLSRLKAAGDVSTYRSILRDYQFDGLDTCAVDGLCSLECPVQINTGELVKRLRKENHSRFGNWVAGMVAGHFGVVERMVRFALRLGVGVNRVFGRRAMRRVTLGLRRVMPAFPLWPSTDIGPARVRSGTGVGADRGAGAGGDAARRSGTGVGADVVYFSCCMTRLMGGAGEALLRVAAKAGVGVSTPSGMRGQCCGQAFGSKGFPAARAMAANRWVEACWQWTGQGAIPVVLDISSCTHSIREAASSLTEENRKRLAKMTILDGVDFAVEMLIPRLGVVAKKESIILHPVCSLHKMGSVEKLRRVGAFAASIVEIPAGAGCCGMAGDRGFYYPGLIQAATAAEAGEVKASATADCYSTSRPCELALFETTGKAYRSIFHLLDEVAGG